MINVTSVDVIWRAAVDVIYGVLMLIERSEWIFPTCSKQEASFNVNRRGSIFSSTNVLVYTVDGRTVAEFLDSITYYHKYYV